MKKLRVSFSTLETYYRTLSAIILNSILLFILINLLAQGYLDFKSARQKGAADGGAPHGHRGYDPSLAPVYPGMDKTQVSN